MMQIQYAEHPIGVTEGRQRMDYAPANVLFSRLYQAYTHKFLLESKDVASIYGRMSLLGVDPVLKISGKATHFCVEVLSDRGQAYFKQLKRQDFHLCDQVAFDTHKITGEIHKQSVFEESGRSKRRNIAQVIRLILEKFKTNQHTFLGLYGAFSYDFIRLFEEIGTQATDSQVDDFTLFLYDTFIFFDHLKRSTEMIVFREDSQSVAQAILKIRSQLAQKAALGTYRIDQAAFMLSKPDYERLVEIAKRYAAAGEIFEVVFSNLLTARFCGDSFALYQKYRAANPSPYLFYFDFGQEQLVGASPEMMVRCEQNTISLRPISGTAPRGADPISDHDNMLALLSDPKERSELDMLIDLGRNDLSRVCEPNIAITDYRFVEKYSRVMHTVAHLSGKLKPGYSAFDALIACQNAGTLTGAPKVAAMRLIEQYEKTRRGYYGGNIGYLTFSGDMDTGIIIRTAHIRGSHLRFQVGATLLYDSVPQKEYQETRDKAQAFLSTFAGGDDAERD